MYAIELRPTNNHCDETVAGAPIWENTGQRNEGKLCEILTCVTGLARYTGKSAFP